MSLANILPQGYKASTYTPTTQAPQRDNSPLPAGLYTVEITAADVKPLKSGRGTGLYLEYTVIDPAPHARRKVWQSINIQHESPQAQDIGLRELSNLCLAISIENPDENSMFQKVLRIRTNVKPAENGYEARAEVKGYESAGVPVKAAPTHSPIRTQQIKAQSPNATAFDDMKSDIPY